MAGQFTPMGVEALVKGLSKFKSDLSEMGSAAEGAGSKMEALGTAGLALGSALGTIAFAAAAAGAAALAGGLALSLKEALASEEVFTRLGAVITAMGDNTTVTRAEAQALAMQFRDLAGGSDEAVAEIIQMGLQMGTVSEEQMPAFIQTALDLAAVTGKDVVQGARLMAQALDDPVGAMQRFSRQGLKVDEATEKQIKALVDAGDVAGGYALLMDRIAKATGGAAKVMAGTFSGQMEIMKNHLLEGAENIGRSFLPTLMELGEGFMPVIDNIEKFATKIGVWIGGMTALFKAAGLGAVLERIFGPAIGGQIEGIINSLMELGGNVANTVGPFMERVGTFISDLVAAATPTVLANIQGMLDNLAIFWEESGDDIMAIVETLLKMAGIVGTSTITFLSGLASALSELLANDAGGFLERLGAALVGLAEGLSGMDLGPGLAAWQGVWDNMKLIVETVLSRLRDILVGIGASLVDGLVKGIRSKIGELKKAVQDLLNSLPAWAKKMLGIGSPSKVFMEIGSNITRGLAEGLITPSVTRALSKSMGSVMAPAMAGASMTSSSSTDNRVGVAGDVNINSGMSAQVFDQRMREWLGA